MRKFERRCSPPVRMTRSGSGGPAGWGAEGAADRLDAGRVALELGQVPGPGPAPVAVHDDRHVAWELRRERLVEGRSVDPFDRLAGPRLAGRRWRVGRADERCAGH